ncbi:MAG: hypothetical protein AABZ60_01355, partial [Planctomycetota bacterium]
MNGSIVRLKRAYPDQEVYLFHQDSLILSPSKQIKLYPFLLDPGTRALITCGGIHSQHALAVAYECVQRNWRCYLFLRGRPIASPLGTHLLLQLLAPSISYLSEKEYRHSKETRMYALAEQLAQQGTQARVIPEGALEVPGEENPLTQQYLQEIRHYEQTHHLEFDRLLIALGTGGTYLHLLKASQQIPLKAKLTGVPALATPDYFIQRWKNLGLENTWELWETPDFRAFGKLDPHVANTVKRVACAEG